MTQRTLFIQFDPDEWDGEEVQNAVNHIDAVLPEDTTVVMVPENGFELMDEERVEQFATQLLNALD